MNATSPQHETDELDRLLSDFFKAQLKQPWPQAPAPGGTAKSEQSEPSELVMTRTADAPRNTPAAPAQGRDNTARARFTLAASVALVLGTGWFLTSGFEPGASPTRGVAPAHNGPGMLPGSDAKGPKGGALDEMQKNKTNDNGGIKVDLGKGE